MNLPRIELVKYLARHPFASLVLVRAGWRLRRRGWWHHRPFVPVAPRDYWEFRLATATGDRGELPEFDDMVQAARWSLHQRVGR
ncbi:MAG TPA: hypothetical protein VGE75_02520 [Acidimicrobiales bacterium]